jgi:hypothetical protein
MMTENEIRELVFKLAQKGWVMISKVGSELHILVKGNVTIPKEMLKGAKSINLSDGILELVFDVEVRK